MSWRATTVQNITYTHNLGSAQPVIIEVSRDGGGSWSPVANIKPPAPPAARTRGRLASTYNAGAYPRELRHNATVNDISNVNFTITIPSVTMNLPNTR